MKVRLLFSIIALSLLAACNGGGGGVAPIPNGAAGHSRSAQATTTTPFDINAGGPTVGNYVADTAFTGGTLSHGTTTTISTAGVTDPAPMQVYQSGRINAFTYTYAGLTPGASYTVRLHFAEYSFSAAGLRKFNVSINGTPVLTNFDIYATAGGKYKAVVEQFNETADVNGNITISFTNGTAGSAMVQGLELIAASGTPAPTPTPTATPTTGPGSEIDINAGGPLVSPYVADTDFTGGTVSHGTTTAISTAGVTNPAPMQVYQSGRINLFTYTFSGLTGGTTYTVRLHFAEYSFSAPGLRQFNVAINGAPVLTNFDIYAAAGGKFRAIVKEFTQQPDSTGKITISFTAGAAGSPMVQGLQLISPGNGPPPTTTPSPTPSPSPTPTIAPQLMDQLTYHVDNLRTGWNQNEPTLTTSNVNSTNFALRQNIAVDGVVMAQPLYVSQYQIGGVAHNMLIVATEHNSVYAFDADTATQLWQVNLGTSQPTGTSSTTTITCGDIQPEYGITGTPVIVRSGTGSGTIFVVAATEPSSGSFHTMLHALDLSNGADLQPPVEISPSAVLSNGSIVRFNAQKQMERTGLLWANNSLYVGIGSHCDAGKTSDSGWLLRYSSSLQVLNQFNTVDDSGGDLLASIWMTGYPAAVDGSGNIYYATGNGGYDANTGGKNYGESVVKMSPALTVLDSFTPSAWSAWNSSDNDFGSGGVMLLPNSSSLVAGGKSTQIFVLNQGALGGESSTNSGAQQVYQDTGNPNGVWGGPAYYSGPAGTFVYYQLDHEPLQQFTFSGSSISLRATGSSSAGYGGSAPVVSSNGQTSGTAIVWVAKRGSTVNLEAYDATNVATRLFSAAAGKWNTSANNSFVTPLVANGRVYVGTAGNVAVFATAPLGAAGVRTANATTKPAKANAPIKPPHFVNGGMGTQLHVTGTIDSVQGSTMTLKRRSGVLLTVDISQALQNGATGILSAKRHVIVWGTRGANGVFHATSISHAGGNQLDWGVDSF